MRVFVLGAGASRHAGYPLTNCLGQELSKWAAVNPPPWNYRYWPDPEGQKEYGPLDDIEEFVTSMGRSEKPERILAGLREAVCGFFDSIRGNTASLYGQFASGVIQDGDIVITFNYDVSLDLELRKAQKWEIGNGYGFDVEIPGMPKSATTLLKLHGSTNWIDLSFVALRPVVLPSEFQFLGYTGVTDPRFSVGPVTRSGSMILPSRDKRFYVSTSVNPREREPFWRFLWGQAETALRTTDEVVIIGYSLPEADAEARRLLLGTSNKHSPLTVCCGGDTNRVGNEFVQNGFSQVRTDCSRFEDWLAAQCVEATSTAKCA